MDLVFASVCLMFESGLLCWNRWRCPKKYGSPRTAASGIAGTLGCFCSDQCENQPMFLPCKHAAL